MFVLEPLSVALIGASEDETKLGYSILKNLTKPAYKGKVYPVNPKHDTLLGLPCFASIEKIPGAVDLAVIVTPAATVGPLVEECGRKKVKTLVIISAGFGELGTEDGHKREAEIGATAKKYGMSVVGPNCLGILRPGIGLNASFAATPSRKGSIALVSQSGAMAVALLDIAEDSGLGFSLVASIGNKADLSEPEFLEICEKDDETHAIGLYLESIKDGKKFVETARRVGAKKSIVLIKSGVSARGSQAVSSHTGALAGSSAALNAACTASGIHRADTTAEFLDLLSVLSTQPELPTNRIAIITNAGGPGVLATDAAEIAGLTLASLDPKTKEILKKALPEAASSANPVDVLGDARSDRYAAAIEACADDPDVDGIVAVLTPQVMTPCEEIAKAVIESRRKHPLIPFVASFMGGPNVREARAMLTKGGIPCLDTPEAAVAALAALRKKEPRPHTIAKPEATHASAAEKILQGQAGLLDEKRTDELFKLYALPVPKSAVASSPEEAVAIAKNIGYPVIAKVSSPDILHKTDVGGVRVNLQTEEDVKKAYKDIVAACKKNAPKADIKGVLIQQFLPIGNEFIVGGLRDSSFGPLVMVGLGGIYTELFRDTCFALAPVTEEHAYEMLSQLKSWKLLLGMRGKAQLDIDELAAVVVRVSQMIADSPQMTEIDLNPVLVSDTQVLIADAKVVLKA